MEVLDVIDWQLHVATPHPFLEQLRAILNILDQPGSPFVMRAEFMVVMSYYEYRILGFDPVVVAAAAMMCYWHQLGDHKTERSNTERLARLCCCDLGELFLCTSTLLNHYNTVFNRPAPVGQKDRGPRADSPDVAGKAPVPRPTSTRPARSGHTRATTMATTRNAAGHYSEPERCPLKVKRQAAVILASTVASLLST